MKRMQLFRSVCIGLLVLQSAFLFAAGSGDGLSKADAIDFDWDAGHEQEPITIVHPIYPDVVESYNFRWYKVGLAPLYEEDNPVLALYLTNLEDQAVNVKIIAQLESQQEEREYTLPAYGFKIWSISAATLVKMKTENVWIQLTSDHHIALSAKVYENIRLDQTCTSSTILNWDGVHQTAASAWYVLDLAEAIASETQKVVLQYANNGSSAVKMTISRSADCPSTGVLTVDTLLGAGMTYRQELTRATLEVQEEDLQYIHVETKGAIDISASLETEDLTGQEISGSAQRFYFDVDNELSANTPTLFYIPMSDLRVTRYAPVFVAENKDDASGTIAYKYSFRNPSPTSMMGEVSISADGDASVAFAANAIEALSSDVENVYFEIESSVAVTLRGRMRHIYEGASCKYPIVIDGDEQKEKYTPGSELWYEVPLEEPRALHGDVTFFIANPGTSIVKLKMERALECPFVVTELSEHMIGAGDTMRIVLADGFNQNMKGDAVYYGLDANKELVVWATIGESQVKRPPVNACEEAQTFNWLTGHRQYEGEKKWYAVNIDTIRHTQSTPQLLVRNMKGAEQTFRMEVSYECPDSLSNMVVEHSIPAFDRYLSASLREQIVNLKEDIHTLYVRVESTGEMAFEMQFVRPEAGKSCLTAIPFNYVSGHDQLENEDLWYAIDIRQAKAETKDVLIHVYNRSGKDNALAAYLTDECPCDVPQYVTYDMKPKEHRTREIVHSLLRNFGDTVYLRVKNEGLVHFEAELNDPEPIYIDACNQAVHLEPGISHEVSKYDTLWFYLLPEDILSDNFSPIITYTDLGGRSTHQASVCFAFSCPVTEKMFERGEAVDVYSSKSIVLERTVVQSLAENDTIYVAFTASDRTSVVFEMADPNTGEDCMHALVMRDGDSARVGKGTHWYRFDTQTMPEDQNAHLVLVGVKTTDTVTCTMYNDCDGVAIRTYKDTLAQNEERVISANKAWLSGYSRRYVYYKVETTDSTDVKVLFTPMASVDTLHACEDVTRMAINRYYDVAAGDTVWFWINVADLRENTTDNVTLVLRNDSSVRAGVERATAWKCPTSFDLLPEHVSIPAGDSVQTVFAHAYLNALVDSIAYLRVTAAQHVKVRLNVKMTRGEDCADPVTFDWVNGNVHPGEEWIWYQVKIDSTKIPVDKDIRLNITNLENDVTEASAHLFFDCRDASLASVRYTFQPNEQRFKDIDRSLLKNLGWADMIIRYNSSNNTHISIELVDSVAVPIVHDSVFAIVCDGADYLDTITNEYHTIDFSDLETRHWTDERDTLVRAFYEHRITDFFITARRDPEPFTEPELATFMPILREGMPVYVDSSLVSVYRYFESIASDSLSLIDTIYWAIPNGTKKETVLDLNTPIGRNVSAKDLRLVVKTQCEGTIRSDVSFMIEPWRTDSLLLSDTICAGETIVLQDGTPVVVERDTVIRDTVSNVEVADTLQLPRLVDSVYVRDIHVRIKPELMPIDHDGAPEVVMQLGLGIDLTLQYNDIDYEYIPDEADLDPIDEWVDSIAFERKVDGSFEPIDAAERLDSTAHEVIIRYVLYTDCQDTMYSPELTVIPQPYQRVSKEVDTVMCTGDTFVPRVSEALVLTKDTSFNDTVKWIIPTDNKGREITTLPAYDSIYVYHVRVRLQPDLLMIDDSQLPAIVLQQGLGIDLSAQVEALASYYETDDLAYEWVDSIAFERLTIDGYQAIDPTVRLDSTVGEVTVRYMLFMDCRDTLYSQPKAITPLPYQRVSDTVRVVLCKGDTFTPRLSDAFVVSEDITFNDTVKWILPLDESGVEIPSMPAYDSIYVYEVRVRVAPELLAIDDARVPEVVMLSGAGIDMTQQQSSLMALYQTEDITYEWVDSIAFERLTIDGYQAIDPTERLDSTVREVTIRYVLFMDCKDTLYSQPLVVTPERYQRVSYNVHAELCKGETFVPRLSEPFVVTEDVTFNDTVKWIIPSDGGVAFDSIYVYDVRMLAHTESITEVTICGDDIPYTWSVIESDTVIYDLKGGTYTIGRTNAAGCDSVMTLVLNVNQPHYEDLPIETHFGFRVLVINRAAIEKKTGWHVEASQVNWYKVGNPDELVREGSDYYTTGEPIVGTYYATIYTPGKEEGDCSTYGRSVTIDCSQSANAPEAPEKEIRNGRLVIRRNGVLYTAEGMPLSE